MCVCVVILAVECAIVGEHASVIGTQARTLHLEDVDE
jgi:hypothetical protein